MTFKQGYKEAFVWVWLPKATDPVVAGRLEENNGYLLFLTTVKVTLNASMTV